MQLTIPTILKLNYYDFHNILFYWFSHDSYLLSLSTFSLYFMSNFWHKKSVSWPLAGSVSLIHSLTRCLAVIYPKTFFPGSLSAYLLSARHCCRHRRDDSEQNKQHPFFCGVFFPPGIFVQFQGIYYPISTGTHPNRFGTHVKWRDCFISFSFFFIIPCVLCYILKKILFWMGFSNIYL